MFRGSLGAWRGGHWLSTDAGGLMASSCEPGLDSARVSEGAPFRTRALSCAEYQQNPQGRWGPPASRLAQATVAA